ncbi:hypothetical protein [Streptomyces sp. AK010]|uniref:hypothetical protein n=1 Tax=Streptomyces sp. AK010 TaxID=2723074 RepID=UPI0018401D79|nr:CubicO group peptidase (beta-lactamase class C family) [Streptomyces sp. AK010]
MKAPARHGSGVGPRETGAFRTVAGPLIERVTHDSYERQVPRRVLGPLGLRDTSFPGTNPRVDSTDAKGQDMNRTAEKIMVAAYGRP